MTRFARANCPSKIPIDLQFTYREIITRLLRWQPETPARLRLSDPAYKEWKTFQRQIENRLAEGGDLDRLHDWGGKLPGAALRIAGILTAATGGSLPPGKIERDGMERATNLCVALIPHAIAAFNLVDEDPIVSLAKRILRWLRKQKEPAVTRRSCFRAMHPYFDRVTEMDAPLMVLAEHFYIRIKTAKTGGRPSEFIETNPRWRHQ